MSERYTGAIANDADGFEPLARVANPTQTIPEAPSIKSIPTPTGKLSSPVVPTSKQISQNNKLDRMLEQQMINDILRANGNLKSLKAFRLANEKLYKDKSLEEARRKEIREPLEDALVEIDLLQGKLQRRDEMIKTLRKQIFSDAKGLNNHNNLLNGVAASKMLFEESRQFKQMMHQEEENKLVNALDKVEQYKIAVNILHKEIHKLKRIIDFQQVKLKDVFAGIEEMEFRHNEQVKKLEGDKAIYMNMIDNRENRIEKLMEDKEELSEQFSDTKAALLEKSKELKQLKEKYTDLESRHEIMSKAKSTLETSKFQLDKDLKISREETRILEEKHNDLLIRYDNLVLELDKMVEEGQFIPDPNAIVYAPADNSPSMGRERTASMDKRRSKAGVKLSEVHRAVKTTKAKPGSKKVFEESTISTDSDEDAEECSDVLGPHISTTKGSISGPSNRSASIANPYIPSTMTMNSLASLNNNPTVQFQTQPQPPPNQITRKDSSANNSVAGTAVMTAASSTQSLVAPLVANNFLSRGQGGGRFSIRKFEEEALAIEKIASSSAVRMKDNFALQIRELEERLKHEQEYREQERKKASIANDTLHTEHRIMTAEVDKLNTKIADLDKYISDLKDELNAVKTANYLLVNGQDTMRISQPRNALFSRLSHTMSTDAHYEGYQEPPKEEKKIDEEEDNQADTHPETSLADVEEEKQHSHSEEKGKDEGEEDDGGGDGEEADIVEVEEQVDDNYMQMDMLAYIYDWENVHKHSKSTQIDLDIVSTEREIQYELEDFMSDEQLEKYHAEQAEIAVMKMDKRYQSSGKQWVGKEVVIQRDDEFYYQLEQLYQSFVHICQHVMPKHKMELLNIDFSSDNWQAKLVNQQLLIGLDIQWQVKYAVALITAFNELRNEFVRKFGHASDYMSLFQRSSETDPSVPEDDLRVTLAIRMIDIILQSLHHILSPMYHIGQSHYPELEKVRAATPIPPMPPRFHDSRGHLAELHEHINTHHDPEQLVEMLQEHARMILSFVDQNDDTERPETFPLTEAPLSSDAAGGHPKGILNTHQETIQHKLKYYMGQSSPRNFPTNIDEVLDMIERRSRSGTPIGSRSRSASPSRGRSEGQTPNNHSHSESRSPSRGQDGSPSQEEPRGRPRHSNRPMTESPTAEQIIKHYIKETASATQGKGVKFSIDGSLIEDSLCEEDEKKTSATGRKRSNSPSHRQPFTSGLLRTLKSREKETTATLIDNSNTFLDYTRLTFDKTGVATAPYHINNVQAQRAKTAGVAVSSSFSDSLNSSQAASSAGTSKASPIPPPSLESMLASSTFSAFRAQSAAGAVARSEGGKSGRRSQSPPRIRTASPLKFLPTELEAIASVASSNTECERAIPFHQIDSESHKLDLSLSNSISISRPTQPSQIMDAANVKGKGIKGGKSTTNEVEELLPHVQTPAPAPIPITPLFFSDSRTSTAGGHISTAFATAALGMTLPPTAPRQATAPTIPHAKFGAASPRPTAVSRVSRPQSSTPSAKYYSPRIHRNIVFPQADTNNCALADTSVMVNIMEDPRIVGNNKNGNPKDKDSFFVVNTVNDETLSISGQRRNISSAKEKVTGASLYI